MPTALIYCMMNTLRTDFKERYGGYPIGTNMIGWSIIMFGLLIIVVPIFICTKEEPFDYKVDHPFEIKAKESFDEQHVEMENKEKNKDEEKSEAKDDEEESNSEGNNEKEGSDDNTAKSSKDKEQVEAST
mmetsp:Transcript_3474/g.2939  ORF Transcript_3474/g.2939 Transcript_3474/m.2939 type:complete len:130 (+) Transcript_3474:584-973(+)